MPRTLVCSELEELEVQNEAEAFLSESALLGSRRGEGVQEELWIRCSRLVAQREERRVRGPIQLGNNSLENPLEIPI